MNRWTAGAAVALAAAAGAAHADTIRVPQDHATIQAAVDAAGENDTVVIARGTYRESIRLLNKTRLRLRGARGAIIQKDSGPLEGDLVHVTGCTDVTIIGLTVQGADDGIDVEASSDVTILRCEITGQSSEGVDIDTQATNVRVIRCDIHDVGTDGVNFQEQATGEVTRTRFRNMDNGVKITDGSTATVVRCSFEDMTGNGVEVEECTDIRVDRCRFERIGDDAVDFASGDAGLEVHDSVVLRCRIAGAGDDGIVVNGDRNVVSRNALKENGSAIHAESGANDTQVDRNRMKGHTGTGIIAAGARTTVDKNRIVRGAKGIEVSGNGGDILRNLISAPTGSGIDVTGTGNAFTRNSVRKAGGAGVSLDATGGNTLTKNRAKQSGTFDLLDLSAGGNTDGGGNRFKNVGP